MLILVTSLPISKTNNLVMALFKGAFILDIIWGYFLKEHSNLARKIVSCLLATLGILTLVS